MTGSTERLYQALDRLTHDLTELARTFERTYCEYLTALGAAVRHQLVLATYHLCTQGYPESFLDLSFAERQELQIKIRRVAKQAQPLMLQVLYAATLQAVEEARFAENEAALDAEGEDEDEDDEDAADLAAEDNEAQGRIEIPNELFETTPQSPAVRAFTDETLPFPPPEALNLGFDLDRPETLPHLTDYEPMTPELLASWQQTLEHGILEILGNLSEQTNQLLQDSDILPTKLPQQIVEAASKSEATAETTAAAPNLLSFLVETGTDESASQLTQLMAIRLRLSEIEFADTTLRGWRDRLRRLSSQLVSLGRDYRKKQRERAVIEAESAWRSSWFDEE